MKWIFAFVLGCIAVLYLVQTPVVIAGKIGEERSVPTHLEDGDEFSVSLKQLIKHGQNLFNAVWTVQEGGGRPLTKGTGNPLSDPNDPLVFPRNFNRISAPEANSCAGCHNAPFGLAGGGGDIVANVFVLGQRFDFVTFDHSDIIPTKGSTDESGQFVTQQSVANSRNTLGMFGSGYIELLAREITADIQAIRDMTGTGQSNALVSKGISFGTIARFEDGSWDTSGVVGIAPTSLGTSGSDNPPSLVIRPFHQAGRVISVREFTNNAFNHHHGIQSTERFGTDTDPDGDGFVNEITRADVTAVTVFQATMTVPGRVIPDDPEVEDAVLLGEERFADIGCAICHIPSLPLNSGIFTEPNPFNDPGNLRVGESPTLSVDLASKDLPTPRLKANKDGVVHVPAFTDLKLHDITNGKGDPNFEHLNMQFPPKSPDFFTGNGKFVTRKLWGCANEKPFYHHGQYTTLREAILAHAGEAQVAKDAFDSLSDHEQDSIVEFLKTLQVLPPGTMFLVVNEKGKPKNWPPSSR